MVWKPLQVPPGDRDPRPIGDSLPDVTKRLGLAKPKVLTAVFARWDEVVGSPLCDHVQPVGLRDGALTVEVDDPAWVTQLRFLHDDLVARVNDATGSKTVTELVVRVRGARKRSTNGGNRPPQLEKD
jgi:predicted nucleic acid-binding Zn ribbon protein